MSRSSEEEDDWGETPVWAEQLSAKEKKNGSSSNHKNENYACMSSTENDDDIESLPHGAQHVLLLIDCHKGMFEKSVRVSSAASSSDHDRKSQSSNSSSSNISMITPFDVALKVVEQLMKYKMKQTAADGLGRRDGVGVMLFNTSCQTIGDSKRKSDRCENFNSDEEDYSESVTPNSQNEDLSDDEGGHYDEKQKLGVTTYELITMEPPGVEGFLELRQCLPVTNAHQSHDDFEMGERVGYNNPEENIEWKDEHRKRDLFQEFGTSTDDKEKASSSSFENSTISSLRVALQMANKVFSNAKCVKEVSSSNSDRADNKSIWVFTNDDNPCFDDEDEKKRLIISAKDLQENEIEISIWPLPRLEAKFDRTALYNFITTKDSYVDESTFLALEQGDLQEILSQLQKQWQKVRRSFTAPLFLPGWHHRIENDPGIQIDFFRPIAPKRKPNPIVIHQRSGKVLTKRVQIYTKSGEIVNSETESQLKRSGAFLRKYMDFGGTHVPITKEEIKSIQKSSNAKSDSNYLILIGFKSFDSVPLEHTVERPYFAYPNDDDISGSINAFTALNDSMLRKNVIGVGELLTKVTSASRIVAIIPQREVREEIEYAEGNIFTEQRQPAGWIVVPLPFEDDLRDLSTSSYNHNNDNMVTCMKDIITQSQICDIEWGYSFRNPSLSQFWRYIEEVALNTAHPDPEDEIEMKEDILRKRIGKQIHNLITMLPPDVIKDEVKNDNLKRKRDLQVDVTGIDWEKNYDDGNLESCKVNELKSFLRSNGMKVSGDKVTMIERIQAFFQNKS